jgi:nucleoside phosphorylase
MSIGVTAVLAALEEELAPLRVFGSERDGPSERHLGVDLVRIAARPDDAWAGELLVVCSGVGKVAAAHAALAAVAAGATRLCVVGTCGGLAPSTPVGALVHADRAVQWDLAVRVGRETAADRHLSALWRSVAPGTWAHFLTADRPAVRLIERWRRQRAFRRARAAAELEPARDLELDTPVVAAAVGAPRAGVSLAVADMETAAVAAVAARAGLPWAACRVVSDAARPGVSYGFARNLPRVGGLPAASVPALLAALASLSR